MWFQTMWQFDKCRFRRACAASVKLSNVQWCSVSSLRVIEYSNDKQRLWSDCAYAQAGLSLCWPHIPHCWKSHVAAYIYSYISFMWAVKALESLPICAGWPEPSSLDTTINAKIWCAGALAIMWEAINIYSHCESFNHFLHEYSC